MTNFLGKIGGRKFLMAIVGVVAIALNSWLGISESATITLGSVIATYILGQGIADGFSGGATSSVANAARDE